jgi:hypothetical protein
MKKNFGHHHTKQRKTESIFSKVRKEAGVFTPFLFNIVLEFLTRAKIKSKKKYKGHKHERKKSNYSYL